MRSLRLSKIMNFTMLLLLAVSAFFVPAMADYYANISKTGGIIQTMRGAGVVHSLNIFMPTVIAFYSLEILAAAALIILYFLLKNIEKNEVFIPQNTLYISIISYIFTAAGAVILIFSLFRLIFIPMAFLAFLFAVVMTVLKNVFAKAVEIKADNDLTV